MSGSWQRRQFVVVPVVLLVVVGGLPATAADATPSDIEQSFVASLDGDAVKVAVDYRVPDRVTELTVRLPVAASDAGRVTATRGFRRTDESTFEWTGAGRPRIELSLSADASRVLPGAGWALLVRPDTSVSYGYRGEQPGVDTTVAVQGEGYVAGALAYLGPYRTRTVVAGSERTTFVVSAAAEPVAVSGAESFLRLAPGRFDLGVRRDATTAFVIPERHDPTSETRVVGAAVETSLWVGPPAVRPNTADTTFAHEYVHTRLGVVGEGSARWLTEASAEYFGNAFALNAGIGDYGTFRRGTDPGRFGTGGETVVLAEPDTWTGTPADYGKGALVLAGLDAEIRRRTDGRHTLADVFVDRPGPYTDHAAFRRAVVGTTGVQSLGTWLDRYATTEASPSLPDEPSLFVYGPDLDPDGDGVPSGRERTRGTDPFVADRPATTAPATTGGTPTPTRTSTEPRTTEAATTTEATTATTTGPAPGFGGPAAAAGLGLAVLSAALAARRRA